MVTRRIEEDMLSKNQAGRSDAELLRLALSGDEAAFLVLYNGLKGGIFRYAFYMTNSKSIAEEVTQEVFMALLREGRNYRPDRGELAAFAFGIARNFVRRIERRERAYRPFPLEATIETVAENLISEPEVVSRQMIRGEVVERVHTAIASLPDHYRQVVVLCDLCELSYVDAACRLACAVGTIRSRLNRGHALLAEKLKPLRSSQPEIRAAGPEGCVI